MADYQVLLDPHERTGLDCRNCDGTGTDEDGDECTLCDGTGDEPKPEREYDPDEFE